MRNLNRLLRVSSIEDTQSCTVHTSKSFGFPVLEPILCDGFRVFTLPQATSVLNTCYVLCASFLLLTFDSRTTSTILPMSESYYMFGAQVVFDVPDNESLEKNVRSSPREGLCPDGDQQGCIITIF